MATSASIKVVKEFQYRGQTRLWSNRYHFDASVPADATKWGTFSDAIVNAEKACLNQTVTGVIFRETLGYAPGSDVPVYTKTYATNGTFAPAGAPATPGDCALMLRYSTSTRTTKNHPLYLYNWYHGIFCSNATNPDVPIAAQVTAFNTYAAAWVTGFSDGTVTHRRCGPNGDLALGYLTSSVIRHRDFPAG